MGNVKPEDVFTPKAIVTRTMFERRNETDLEGRVGLQDTLRGALLERGGQVLIYGETGVGKSSLLKYCAEDEQLGTVTVSCKSTHTLDGLLEALVRKIVTVEKISKSKTKSVGGEAGVEGQVPWFAKIVGKITTQGGESTEFRVVQKSALDVITLAMDKSKKSLIVLDNFQNIENDDTRSLIAQTMEELSDQANEVEGGPNIKCVVIGISESADSLLGSSRSFERRTSQIGVPRMPDDEIRAILRRGFEDHLKIALPADVLDHLVFYSDGFPYFAHTLGLHLARAARAAQASTIDASMVDPALRNAALAVAGTYQQRIRRAYEAGGEVQPRKQIMRLLALSGGREWGSSDVQALWDQELGARSEYSFMHTALAQLSRKKYGKVLVRSGSRGKYRYRFEDPHMRPYLRLLDGASALDELV